MTAFRSIGAPLENDGSGTEPIEVRKDLAGLVTGAGVLPGADSPLVSGTAGWAYQVGRCNLVSSRGSSDGVHLWGNDGPVTVSTADDGTSLSAPGSGVSRVDIIYGLHPSNGENADTTSQPYFAVRKGTPASSPQPPTLPTGALELARNTMTSSATSTSSTGNSIQQTAEAAEPIESAPLTIQYSSEANVDMTGAANAWVDWLTLATLNVPSWATRVDVVIEVNAMTYSSPDVSAAWFRTKVGATQGTAIRGPYNPAGGYGSWVMSSTHTVSPGASLPLVFQARRNATGGVIRVAGSNNTIITAKVRFYR
ncbi:hypothetical protein [Cellulomonas denverensis]|uniref:hypothetical protein n=1 Tax=Cellulomonas denverensis TaxID=264297 RepID=UPI0035ED7B38